MQVDFYHLTRDPAEKLVPLLSEKSLQSGAKVLIVSGDEVGLAVLGDALWRHSSTSFLAHDIAGSEREADQPILISGQCDAANGAKFVILADGSWREEALSFERAFYLFTAQEIDAARNAWRDLASKDGVTPRYWKQDGGSWVEGPLRTS